MQTRSKHAHTKQIIIPQKILKSNTRQNNRILENLQMQNSPPHQELIPRQETKKTLNQKKHPPFL